MKAKNCEKQPPYRKSCSIQYDSCPKIDTLPSNSLYDVITYHKYGRIGQQRSFTAAAKCIDQMAKTMEVPLDPNAPSSFLGNLPESGIAALAIPDTVPVGARKWLIYTYVTVEGAQEVSGRAYYDFTSTEGDKTYHRLMNVAFFKDTVVNSMNVWFPANSSRKLTVTLENAEIKQKSKRAPGTCGMADFLKCTEDGTHTGAFVIGYEM